MLVWLHHAVVFSLFGHALYYFSSLSDCQKHWRSKQISSSGDWWEGGYGCCSMVWIDGQDVGQVAETDLIRDRRMESEIERRWTESEPANIYGCGCIIFEVCLWFGYGFSHVFICIAIIVWSRVFKGLWPKQSKMKRGPSELKQGTFLLK